MQEPWMKKIVNEIKNEFGTVEVKKIGHNYYVYKVSSIYDKEKKRAKKISGEYIGRITMNGLEKKRPLPTSRSVFEYGNARILFLAKIHPPFTTKNTQASVHFSTMKA